MRFIQVYSGRRIPASSIEYIVGVRPVGEVRKLLACTSDGNEEIYESDLFNFGDPIPIQNGPDIIKVESENLADGIWDESNTEIIEYVVNMDYINWSEVKISNLGRAEFILTSVDDPTWVLYFNSAVRLYDYDFEEDCSFIALDYGEYLTYNGKRLEKDDGKGGLNNLIREMAGRAAASNNRYLKKHK